MAEAIEAHRALHCHNGCFDYVFVEPGEFLRQPVSLTRNYLDQLYDWLRSKGHLPAADALDGTRWSHFDLVVAGRMFLQSLVDGRRIQLRRQGYDGRRLNQGAIASVAVDGPRPSLLGGYWERKILGGDLVVLRFADFPTPGGPSCRCPWFSAMHPELARYLGAKR
jgi:hypothetical protein